MWWRVGEFVWVGFIMEWIFRRKMLARILMMCSFVSLWSKSGTILVEEDRYTSRKTHESVEKHPLIHSSKSNFTTLVLVQDLYRRKHHHPESIARCRYHRPVPSSTFVASLVVSPSPFHRHRH